MRRRTRTAALALLAVAAVVTSTVGAAPAPATAGSATTADPSIDRAAEAADALIASELAVLRTSPHDELTRTAPSTPAPTSCATFRMSAPTAACR